MQISAGGSNYIWTGIRRATVGGLHTQSFSAPFSSSSDIGPWFPGYPSSEMINDRCMKVYKTGLGLGFVDSPCDWGTNQPLCEIQQLS